MSRNELPTDKAARVDWVIRAQTNSEMRRRYDLWAACYDSDLGSFEEYLVPRKAARVAAGILPRNARILDAGAGTGLVGECLRNNGFRNILAADFSEGMLEVARAKGVYQSVHVCDLSRRTDFTDNAVDCVITCGTTSQIPSSSLREYARLARPGGCIIFGVIPDAWEQHGYAREFSDLESGGLVRIESRGKAFQMLPTTEPDFLCEMWVIRVSG